MSPDEMRTRRSAIRFVGATAIGTLLAGCGGPILEDDGEGESDETAPGAWADVDTIELEAEADGWIGRSPDEIADENNPTLELYAGREYELTWENGDGEYHNLSIHSRNEDVEEQLVEDERLEATELLQAEGESIDLTFEATAEMQGYVCEMHPQEMAAEITIHEDGGDEDEGGNQDGDENGSDDGSEDESDGDNGNETENGSEDESDGENENGTENGE